MRAFAYLYLNEPIMKRRLRIASLTVLTVVCLAVAAGWLSLRGSLPRRSGSVEIAGLSAGVTLEFDARGIVRIRGAQLLDAVTAQGFVHAQDRFFQMDLTRRSAAGELAALFGSAAIDFDMQRRRQQLRERARRLLAAVPPRHRARLERYAAGVNAGLADLRVRPPEYLLLRQAPEPWQAEDSMLVVLALYTMLSNNDSWERHNGALRDLLPKPVFEFLTPTTARGDRPLAARDAADRTGGYEPAAIPSPADLGLRHADYDGALDIVRQPLSPNGSNNWAVVGAGAGSQAIVANDPHLSLRVPNIFHRAELYWDGGLLRGVGIPGLPGIVIGANEHVAWGATVSYADQADLVVVDIDASDPGRYLVSTGAEPFTVERELIEVAGGEPVETQVQRTRWGPVVGQDYAGRPLALRATWLDADGLDLSLLDIAHAAAAADAVELLRNWRGPSLNWVAADSRGSIGWTVNGPVPRRRNFDGSVPEPWGSGAFGWRGTAELPSMLGSGEDFVYSANNRQLTMPYARTLSRLTLSPHRARAIAEALETGAVTDEASSLALQLDTRVAAFDVVRNVILEAVAPEETDAALARARAVAAAWNGRADADSAAMPLLDRYYDQLLERLIGPIVRAAHGADSDFRYRWPLVDEVLRRLLEEKPAHLLPARYPNWNAWLRDILRDTIADVPTDARWGAVNRLDVRHPLGSIPGLGAMLNWPQSELPGNTFSLRVAQPGFGAVIRMSVRPASPTTGILQFAGGQSGHFLSPHYDDQLADWASGAPTPFLAGRTQREFTLRPGAAQP